MELDQLVYFQKTAELQHFTQAAAELFISQPALTHAMKKLEEEFDAPMFKKKGRNIELTEYGKILLEHVNPALEHLNLAKKEIAELKHTENCRLTAISRPLYSFPGLMEKIIETNPNISINYIRNDMKNARQHLLSGKIDFYLGPIEMNDVRIRCIKLIESPLVLAVSEKHHLSDSKYVKADDLSKLKYAGHEKGTVIRSNIEKKCIELGFVPNVQYEGTHIEDMLAAARSGQYALILPVSRLYSDISMRTSQLKIIPILGKCTNWATYFCALNEGDCKDSTNEILKNVVQYFSVLQKQMYEAYPELRDQ